MSLAVALDHVGIIGRDLTALAAQYQRLGFSLAPHALAGGGRIENRCVMLRQGYLELLAVAPGGSSATLERFLACHDGAHIIALAVDDEAATLTRLHRAGIDCPGVEQSDRLIDAARPDGPRARFAHLPIPEPPEARINLIRHLTPELLWQLHLLEHANHAVAIAEVILVVPAPAESATRLSRLTGRPVVPDPAGGYALDLSRGTIRLLAPNAWESPPPALPAVVGITLHTDDANAAIMRIVAMGAIPHRIESDMVTIAPAGTGGVALRFESRASHCHCEERSDAAIPCP